MIVKRKKQQAVKGLYTDLSSKTVDKKGLGVHIFTSNLKGKTHFSFIVSKQSQEVAIPSPDSILVNIDGVPKDSLKTIMTQIGKSFRSLNEFSREVYDNDIAESLKSQIKEVGVQCNIETVTNLSVYRTPEEKVAFEQKIKNAPKRSNFSEEDQEIMKVRPYALLQTLKDRRIIRIEKEEPNSDEIKVKFQFADTAKYGHKKFNISVAKLDASAGNKAQLFNDFVNQKNKALGTGSVGLMAHLGEYGLFDFNQLDDVAKKEYAKEFFKNNILPSVPERLKMEYTSSFGLIYFKDKTVTVQPIEKDVPRVKNTMIDFLKYRGISIETIDGLIENNNLIFGDFYNSRIVPDLDKHGREKPNYSYKNATYFRLNEGWSLDGKRIENKAHGAERFEVKRTPTGEKPFEYDKKNIGPVDGKAWSYGNHHNPEKALIHEAIIDGISSHEIFKESGIIDPAKQRYFSTQGANNMNRLFQKNIGIWSDTKTINGKIIVDTKFYELRGYYKPLDDDKLEQYKSKLGHKEIIYFKPKSPKKGYIPSNLKHLQEKFGFKLTFVDIESRDDIDFEAYSKKDTILLEEDNYEDFLNSTKLKTFKKGNTFEISAGNPNYRSQPLNAANKKKIADNVKKFFGTEHLVFCLDNDHAGLKHMKMFTELERHIGIDVSYMIPNDAASSQPYQNYKGLNLKSFQEQYINFVENGKYDQAYELLDQYIEQKPEIDNNDVLKSYLRLKDSNPEKAEALMQSKMNQLKPVRSPDGIKARALREKNDVKKNNGSRLKP